MWNTTLNFLMSVLDKISKISSYPLLNFILSRFHLGICPSRWIYHPIRFLLLWCTSGLWDSGLYDSSSKRLQHINPLPKFHLPKLFHPWSNPMTCPKNTPHINVSSQEGKNNKRSSQKTFLRHTMREEYDHSTTTIIHWESCTRSSPTLTYKTNAD